MIQAEYGWSDKHILKMTYDRFRQVRDVIMERREERRLEQVVLQERSTRALLQQIAGAAGWEQGFRQGAAWELVPGYVEPVAQAEPELDLPDTDKLLAAFGGSGMTEGQVDWSEIEKLADQYREDVP